MAPKASAKFANVMHKFHKDLAQTRGERGPRAAPGSGFKTAGASSSGQVIKIVKYVRVRPSGHSIFSIMAHGFEPNKNDPEVGMRLEIMDEVEDGEAMAVVEKQSEVKRAFEEVENKKEQERQGVARAIELKRTADEKARKETRKLKLRSRRKALKNGDDEAGIRAPTSRNDESGIQETDEVADGAGETDEDEAYRIKIPVRRTPKKTKDGAEIDQ